MRDLPPKPPLTRRTGSARSACSCSVFLSTFPVAIPFLVFAGCSSRSACRTRRARDAVRRGYWLAKTAAITRGDRLSMVLLGVVLVAIAIALGG